MRGAARGVVVGFALSTVLGCSSLARGLPDAALDGATDAPEVWDATDRAAPGDVSADRPTTDVVDVPGADARDAAVVDVADVPRADVVDVPVMDAPADRPDAFDAPVMDAPADRPDVVDAPVMDAPADRPDVVDAPADRPDVVDAPEAAVCDPMRAARPIGPLSGSQVTSRRPLLRWALPPAATGAVVEFCRERSCATILGSETVTGSALRVTRADLLAASVVWWRVAARQGAMPCGPPSVAWALWPGATAAVEGYAFRPLPDFNGDGRTDTVISAHNTASGVGRAQVYLGQPDGLPRSPSQTIAPPVAGLDQFGMPWAADFNGDGLTDALIAAANRRMGDRGRAWQYLSDGARLVTPRELVEPAPGYTHFATLVYTGDFNGDGYGDAAVTAGSLTTTDPSGGRIHVYQGSAEGLSGTPAATIEGTDGSGSNFGNGAAVLDLDGDGYDDMLVNVFTNDSRAWVVLRGSGAGLRREPTRITSLVGAAFPGAGPIALGDVTGDGRVDFGAAIFTASPRVARVTVAAGTAAAPFGATGFSLDVADAPTALGRLVGADIDLDGRSDLVLAQTVSGVGRLYVYPSRGASFGAHSVVTPRSGEPDLAQPFTVGDYNGDGLPDLLSSQYTYTVMTVPNGAYSLFLGASGGTFPNGARVVPGPDADSYLGFRLARATTPRRAREL